MSRYSDYDDYEGEPEQVLAAGRWERNARVALKGKRGRKALAELREALMALPERRLIEGAVCTVGAAGRKAALLAEAERPALYGPQRCTCWEPVFDLEQREITPGLPLPPIPVQMCQDCAYRPHSPEREGEDGYAGDRDLLDELVRNREPFYCHRGIRKPVAYKHPVGAEAPGHPAAYDPPTRDGVPYKADGTPANLCAGWLLRCAKETADAGERLARCGQEVPQ
jgi:hypothetical protein